MKDSIVVAFLGLAILCLLGCETKQEKAKETAGPTASRPRTGEATRPKAKNPSSKPSPGRDYRNALGMHMVWCPAGSFLMGEGTDHDAERPVHKVTIETGFWIGATEVTQGQWEACGRSHRSPQKGKDLPVTGVSWADAMNFCSSLGARDFAKGVILRAYRYDLPTEAMWEYACRGATQAPSKREEIDAFAWHEGNSEGRLHPVATRKANSWGLYDMLGNASEWVIDPFHHGYTGAPTDGRAWTQDGTSEKVTRGGHYDASFAFCRPSFRRFFWNPGGGPSFNGFRVALVPRKRKK